MPPSSEPTATATETPTANSDAPVVSVLICNFNHGRFLEQAITGVLRQSFPNFELLLTDDGSTDGSQEIIQRHAAKDPRIKPTYFPQNRGAMAATQNNLTRVAGSLIYGGAADDFIIDKDFFKLAVTALEKHPQAAGFYGRAGLLSAETNKLCGAMGSAPREGYISPADFFRGFLTGTIFVPGNSSIWRRTAMDEMGGFDYSLGPQIDYLVNHGIPVKHGVVFSNVPVTCQRVYESNSNYGSKGSLWEAAARFAKIEERLRAIAPAYEGMDADWQTWRAFWMIDAIQKTTGTKWARLAG